MFFEQEPHEYTELACFQNHQQSVPTLDNHFARQDSLAECASLQEKDRQNSAIIEFMETEMSIPDYIDGLGAIEDIPDEADQFDNDLLKEKDYSVYSSYDLRYHVNSVDSRSSSVAASICGPVQIKQEPNFDYDDEKPYTSSEEVPTSSRRSSRVRDASRDLKTFTPSYQARKYELKPETEKATDAYKLKRARNNDAVRKSRSKQKEAQELRDLEMNRLKSENNNLKHELEKARALIFEKDRQIQVLSSK